MNEEEQNTSTRQEDASLGDTFDEALPSWLITILDSTWLDRVVNARLRASMPRVELARAKLLALSGVMISIFTLLIAYGHVQSESWFSAGILCLCAAISFTGFALVNRLNRPLVAVHLINFALVLGTVISIVKLGGPQAVATRWLAVLPVVALAFGNMRAGIAWFFVAMFSFIGLSAAPSFGFVYPQPIKASYDPQHLTITMIVFMIAVFLLFAVGEVFRRWSLGVMKEQERELKVAYTQAVEASDAKTRFLARMSHELRTPLNIIIGYSELLQEDYADVGLDEAAAKDLATIVDASQHLLGMISGILDLSRIETGHVDIHEEEFLLSDLIKELQSGVLTLMEKNQNEFILQCDEHLNNASICTDYYKVKQILLNFLSNAAKFTSHGKVSFRISTVENVGKTWIRFEVEDSGIGIAEDHLEHIWDEFSQADESTIREFGGTGIGLALVRQFAILLHGKVGVDSARGEGSRFYLELDALESV